MDIAKVIACELPENTVRYTFKESILYALSVGFAARPLDPDHLRFTYEKNLQAVPTMANVLGHPGFWLREPAYRVDWARILHAEHRLQIYNPLPPEGTVRARHTVAAVVDKGPSVGTFIHQTKALRDLQTNDDLCAVTTTLLARGDCGSGNYGQPPPALLPLPNAPAEREFFVQTSDAWPLLYRLNGDMNPLHVDPAIAVSAGFKRPILHGLCSMGAACYAILFEYCGFDASRIKSLALRFSRPVLPGSLLRFEFWQPAPTLIRFRAQGPGGEVVLDRGLAELGEHRKDTE